MHKEAAMSVHQVRSKPLSGAGWPDFIEELQACLQFLEVSSPQQGKLPAHQGFSLWEEQASRIKEEDRGVFFVGNGASSSMCSHFMTDIGKNGGLRTQMFGDAALLTALGNDIAFDQVFAEPLRRHARSGDMLVAISSSGNSPNIVEAAAAAREKELWIITLTGMKPDNRLRSLGDLNFWVNAGSYGMVETAHAAILHYWTDCLVARHGGCHE